MTQSSLYDVLGVAPDADADALKAAHRKLAKEHHPDKHGGDDSQFKVIQQAYDVLKDPEKRAHYDRTGETDLKDPEAMKDREARKFAADLIEMAIENIDDFDGVDIVGECLIQIDNKITEINGHIRKHKAADKRAARALKRLKLKEDAEDFLAGAITRKREKMAKELEAMANAVDVVRRVRAIYEGYDYAVDARPAAFDVSRAAGQANMRPEDFDRVFGHLFRDR